MGVPMKFVCDKDTFAREIGFAQDIVASKNAMSIMSNVYLEVKDARLLIRATDVKVGFETEIAVSDTEPGSLTVFCDKLTGTTSSLPEGDIIFEQHDGILEIKPVNRKIRFELRTLSGNKFPELPRADMASYFSVPARDLRRMIAQTIFSVSNDETRFFMNGILLEKLPSGHLAMVSTDGRRLAFIAVQAGNIPDFKSIIIPPKVLSILYRRASDEGMIDIAVTEKNVFFRFAGYEVSSLLIEGQFPNYQKVIPREQRYHFTVKKDEILSALRRVSLFVEKSNRVILNLTRNGLVMESGEAELGGAREELACEYEGPDVVIHLNYKYLEEPVKVLEGDTLAIEFTDPTRAVTMRPEPASDYFHIVMPMQQP